jgi:hypothetical protein
MFIEVLESMVGEVPVMGWGVSLEISGEPIPVPFSSMEAIELDAEDLDEATELYLTYEGEEYVLPLPERDSRDWQILEEVIDPE